MKIDMKILRWVLLFLYISIIIALFAGVYFKGSTVTWLFPFGELQGKKFWTIAILGLTILSQIIFIFTAGTKDLCKPLRKRRVVLPIIMASFMMMVLVIGVLFALTELFYVNIAMYEGGIEFVIMGLVWLLWGLIFYARYSNVVRLKLLKKLVNTMIAGSLIDLLASIPSHMIVGKRPGCFVGLQTAMGVCAGIMVMLWAFGPGVIVLFLAEKRKAELGKND